MEATSLTISFVPLRILLRLSRLKKHTRLRLGVLAINAGLMTAEQVEHVNITQQSVDKRFGDLAVELGYVTADDVEKLLAQQPTDYLLLGQTLVNNGALTNAEFEKALKDYKAENQITDDISTIKQKLYITLSMSSIILTMMKMLVSVLIMLLFAFQKSYQIYR